MIGNARILTAPAVQSHLPKLIFLFCMKMRETKWKMSMIPFSSWPKYIFALFSMSPFLFEIRIWHIQKFSNDFCECCSMVACQCLLVAWGDPLPPVGILLSSGTSLKGCVLVLQCINLPLSFQLSFQFMKPFSWILPWRTNSLVGKRALWWFRHFLSVWARGGCSFPSGGLCSFKGEDSFLPPQGHSWYCYMPLFLLVSYLAPELLWLYWGKGFRESVAASAVKGIIFLL